jgi:hypothetical protein
MSRNIGAFQRRYCFLGWSWKLCRNSLVPFVVLGDFVGCRRLVFFGHDGLELLIMVLEHIASRSTPLF